MAMIRQRRALGVVGGAIFAAAVALGCAEDTPGATYSLSGRVTKELTEGGTPMPLGGALVRFTSDTGLVHETTSRDDGRYDMEVFTDTPFGQVYAEAAGYDSAERTVYFDNPERRIDLVLRPLSSM